MPWATFWVVSHWAKRPRWHIQHRPHEMLKGTTTRSPGWMRRDVGADLLDDPHELVAEHVTGLQVGGQRAVEVQVRPADRGGGDADHGVGGLLDDGIGYLRHTDVLDAVPGECSHDH